MEGSSRTRTAGPSCCGSGDPGGCGGNICTLNLVSSSSGTTGTTYVVSLTDDADPVLALISCELRVRLLRATEERRDLSLASPRPDRARLVRQAAPGRIRTTSSLEGWHSIQLSYGRAFLESRRLPEHLEPASCSERTLKQHRNCPGAKLKIN